jgi:cellulose synthase/poly-beta-1,6-N-acetylglucosamine synthase-like glycosyltransferase
VKAEVPLSIGAFKKQQFRWAKGSIQVALKLAGPMWASKLPLRQKCEAIIHLFSYAVHPLMVLVRIATPYFIVLISVLLLYVVQRHLTTPFRVAPEQNSL